MTDPELKRMRRHFWAVAVFIAVGMTAANIAALGFPLSLLNSHPF